MNVLQKYIVFTILAGIVIVISFNLGFIFEKINSFMKSDPEIVIPDKNEYARNLDYEFIQITEDFSPNNYQDLLNIFYTVLDSGWQSFTFYCDKEYNDCLKDVQLISENEILLTDINNHVHPFNSYLNIKTSYYENGEVTLKVKGMYASTEITEINSYVDNIIKDIIKSNMSEEQQLRAAHDWIINNTKYDTVRADTGTSPYKSNGAYGALFENQAICGGYSDTYQIFLDKLGFRSFKVASETHIWNAVLINGEYLNVDLTWDDPISNTGKDNLWHRYFLIPSSKFAELDKDSQAEHFYNKTVYSEVKE